MAITYPLTLPSPPAYITLTMNDVAGVSSSPWTGQQQVHQHQGAWWECEFTLPPMKSDDIGAWRGFFASLRGPVGTFYVSPYWTNKGAGGGTPLVFGGSQTGYELATNGWPASTLVLKKGDFFQVGSELKTVTADATSNESGVLTIDIWPPIRTSPANGESVVTTNPVGLFRLKDRQRWIKRSPGDIYEGMTVMGLEAF